jgi:hypothetical protein
MLICILKSIVASVILMLVGTNLIGFIVRGLVGSPPPIETEPGSPAYEVIAGEAKRISAANSALTIIGVVVTAAYFFLLFYFWNALFAIAAGLSMVARIPDLLWEIRIGRRAVRGSRPEGGIYLVGTILPWLTLVLVWYALCR